MTECRHGLSEDCPGCMQDTIDAAFATCIMIVEEECGLDKKPAQGRDNYVHGKYDVGMAIVDRIMCAQRSPDETRMRVPAQRAPSVTDEMVKAASKALMNTFIKRWFLGSYKGPVYLDCVNGEKSWEDEARAALTAALTSTECGDGK